MNAIGVIRPTMTTSNPSITIAVDAWDDGVFESYDSLVRPIENT
jgi:hypothetical protein